MIELAHSLISELAEGPLWDERTNSILWVDILKGDVHELEITSKSIKTYALNQCVGSVALSQKGNLLMAAQNGLALYTRSAKPVKTSGNLSAIKPGFRFNDGKCGPDGRFWVGILSEKEEVSKGSLYKAGPALNLVKSMKDLTIPNGMAWSKDGNTFYFIDTPTQQIISYNFKKSSGTMTSPKVVISVSAEDGAPDGMTIDQEDMLWTAQWNGWKILRWNPVTGEKLYELNLPVAKVTSCCFGGKHLTDLYITTARIGLTDQELRQQPLAGSLFVWKNSGYKGLPASRFTEP